MAHLPGISNASNGLTKPVSWVLHSRHARRGMGHYKLGSPMAPSSTQSSPNTRFVGARDLGSATEPVTDVIQDLEGDVMIDRSSQDIVSG